jgi:hypothetical protein
MHLEADLNISESWSEQESVGLGGGEGEKGRGESVGSEGVRISTRKKLISHSKIGREIVLLLSVSVK